MKRRVINEEQKRAWIYCRIDAPEDVYGRLKNQKKELYNYAEQMGFAVAGSSEDMGDGLDIPLMFIHHWKVISN